MAYNYTNISANSTDLLTLTLQVNDILMYGMLGNLMLFVIFCIATMAFYQSTADIAKAITSASFISFLLSVILVTVGLVPALTVYILLIMSAASLGFTWNSA